MLNDLNEQTKNIHNLLENLLWWSNSQKEGLSLQTEIVQLNPIVDNIKLIYQTIAQNKSVSIEVKLTDDINVFADKDALGLILRNLVGNAIKYSPKNSTVQIKCFKQNDKVQIEIIDHGKGINPDIIQAIQNNDKIQSLPGTDSEKGMGLGLTLCYEFVHKMKGEILLCDKYENMTCFCVELPAVK